MMKVNENGTINSVNPVTLNRWFESMKQQMLQNPEREKEIDKLLYQEEQKKAWHRYMSCGAPKEALQESGWDKFIIAQNCYKQSIICNIMREYAYIISNGGKLQFLKDEVNQDGNILINGRAGTGKTFFALSVIKQLSNTKKPPRLYLSNDEEDGAYKARNLYVDEYYQCSYVKSSVMVNELTIKDYSENGKKKACWNTYTKADFLVIDNCFGDGGYKEREELKILSQILEIRMESRKPTMLITGAENPNINEKFAWQDYLGLALFSKLQRQSLIIDTEEFPDMRDSKIQHRLRAS